MLKVNQKIPGCPVTFSCYILINEMGFFSFSSIDKKLNF